MPPQILVVDDDRAVRRMLARLLSENGYEARQAADACEARSLTAGQDFSLLIFDVVMPGESGLELAADLRRRGCRVPIILISGFPAEGPVEFAEEHQDVAFVPKPFSADHFLSEVECILAKVER